MKKLLIVLLCLSSYVFAIPSSNLRPLQQAANVLVEIANEVGSLDEDGRDELRRKLPELEQLVRDMKRTVRQLRPSSGNQGWYQVYGDSCQAYCSLVGKSSTASSDGAVCTSGEARPQSAAGKVSYVSGCWPNCTAEANITTFVRGIMCYKPGQKQDNDWTDITVGCFCK